MGHRKPQLPGPISLTQRRLQVFAIRICNLKIVFLIVYISNLLFAIYESPQVTVTLPGPISPTQSLLQVLAISNLCFANSIFVFLFAILQFLICNLWVTASHSWEAPSLPPKVCCEFLHNKEKELMQGGGKQARV